MKRYTKFGSDELLAISADMDQIKDLRFFSIIGHQFVEYFINEIIRNKFENPKLIIDKLGFYQKFTLLEAMGCFKGKDDLKKNVELITNIRNTYAHDMMYGDEIPQEIVDRIKEMKYLEEANIPDGKKHSEIDIENKFRFSFASTIVLLFKMETDAILQSR